jgi:hypothetical protein
MASVSMLKLKNGSTICYNVKNEGDYHTGCKQEEKKCCFFLNFARFGNFQVLSLFFFVKPRSTDGKLVANMQYVPKRRLMSSPYTESNVGKSENFTIWYLIRLGSYKVQFG